MGGDTARSVRMCGQERVRQEMYRYMGCGGTAPAPEVASEAEQCLSELRADVEPKTVWRRFPLELPAEGMIRIEGMEIQSCALYRNLTGCREVFLMGATLGLAPDRMTARAQAAGRVSRAVMIQAAAAALIEDVCDELNEELRQEAAREGKILRPRFSPGYGDFSLKHQRELFRILELQKRIGVTLTEHLLMMPSKSVTAVIGISDVPPDARRGTSGDRLVSGCDACDRTDCGFRKSAAGKACERSHA